jgi:hypothetical protein
MKQKFTSILAILIALGIATFGQTTLEMGTLGGPAGNGPFTTSQTVTLYENGSAVFSPAVTATYSLSNQQFAVGTVEGLASNSGMSFGGNLAASVNSPMGVFSLYSLMNGISSPTNNLFTACNAAATGTGIDVTTNRSISLFNCTDALINSASVNQQLLNARIYYGDLTITFNRPISNPVMQFVGLGGAVSFSKSGKNYDMGFATEFDLLSTGVTLSKLSGNTQLNVTATQVTNNATWLGASSVGTASNGITRYGASGSVVALGTNITSITLKVYVRGDGGRVNNGTSVVAADAGIYPVWALGATNPFGLANPNVAGDVMLFGVSFQKPVNVSGNIFNDANGGNVNNSTGGANVISTGIFANLIDANGKVVASVAVNTDGTYTFPAVFEGNYTMNISTTLGVQGAMAPGAALPAGWVNTGEFNGVANTGNDGTINGNSAVFTVAATDVTDINFGIERLPESNNQSYTIGQSPAGTFITLNGIGSLGSPGPLTGSDPEDFNAGGSLNAKSVAITELPSNSELWYNGVKILVGADGINPPSVSNPFVIPNYNPSLLQVKITSATLGSVATSFKYAYIDAAGKMDNTPATYTINWAVPLAVEGLVLTAIINNDVVLLNWATLSESNTAYFEIERSKNNLNFIKVGINITAGGYTINKTNYNYNDDLTAIEPNTIVYYRVKLYDKNGDFKYSNVITVKRKTTEVKVWPNPFAEKLLVNITTKNTGIVQLNIKDILGRTIIAQQYKASVGNNQFIVSGLATLIKGAYIIEIINDKESFKEAFKISK